MYENESNKYTYDFELKVEGIEESVTAIKEWWISR